MLDADTRKLIETSKPRRQVELSVRFVAASPAPGRPDPRAEAVQAQVWDDLKQQLVAAVGAYDGDGLRVLRHLKTRPEMILSGPVATWRRFLDEKRALVAAPTVEVRHFIKPWNHGLPGVPE